MQVPRHSDTAQGGGALRAAGFGVVNLFITIVGIAVIAGVAGWILSQIPTTPPIVIRIIWIVAVVFIVLYVVKFFGYPVPVPSIR